MKLNYLTFMIRDLEASIAFYQEMAGLHVHRRFRTGQGEIAFLVNAEGETMLELIAFEGAEKILTKGMVVSFSAQGDLSALREKAVALGYAPTELIDEGQKPRHFTLPDPDGILVEFSS